MPYKKQKAIRSNKKSVIYDLMTDLGLHHVLPSDTPVFVVKKDFRNIFLRFLYHK